MKRSKFSAVQIMYAIRQADTGTPVGDFCRQIGVSDATVYAWRQKYAHLDMSELRRLRQLEAENSRLKRLVADLSIDQHILSEALRKKSLRPARRREMASGFRHLSGLLHAGLTLDVVRARLLVSTEPREGSIRSPDMDSRSRPCPPAVWVLAHPGVLERGQHQCQNDLL